MNTDISTGLSRREILHISMAAVGSQLLPLGSVRAQAKPTARAVTTQSCYVLLNVPHELVGLDTELDRPGDELPNLRRLRADGSVAVLRSVDVRRFTDEVVWRKGPPNGFLSTSDAGVAQRLGQIARLLEAGVRTRVFDTGKGAFARGDRKRMLAELDEAIGSLARELSRLGLWDRATIAVVPESGRAAPRGTAADEPAGTVLLAGGAVQKRRAFGATRMTA